MWGGWAGVGTGWGRGEAERPIWSGGGAWVAWVESRSRTTRTWMRSCLAPSSRRVVATSVVALWALVREWWEVETVKRRFDGMENGERNEALGANSRLEFRSSRTQHGVLRRLVCTLIHSSCAYTQTHRARIHTDTRIHNDTKTVFLHNMFFNCLLDRTKQNHQDGATKNNTSTLPTPPTHTRIHTEREERLTERLATTCCIRRAGQTWRGRTSCC